MSEGTFVREEITVYTRAWAADAPFYKDGEEPQQASIGSVVFIDGKELQCALGASVVLSGEEFTRGTIEVAPAKWNIVALDEHEWQERFGLS